MNGKKRRRKQEVERRLKWAHKRKRKPLDENLKINFVSDGWYISYKVCIYGWKLTLELPRRRWCDAVVGNSLLSVTVVRSLVDFRQHNETTLSEQVRSNVECDVFNGCQAKQKQRIKYFFFTWHLLKIFIFVECHMEWKQTNKKKN